MRVPQPTFTQQPPIGRPLFTMVTLSASGAAVVAAAKAAEPPPDYNLSMRLTMI